jgi:hypothetical protein
MKDKITKAIEKHGMYLSPELDSFSMHKSSVNKLAQSILDLIVSELPKKHNIEVWDKFDSSDDYCHECGQFDYTCNYNRCLKDVKQRLGVGDGMDKR